MIIVKRKVFLLMGMIVTLVMLTGCYSSDMNFKLGYDGSIDFSSVIVGTNEAIKSLTGKEESDELITSQIEDFDNYYKSNATDAEQMSVVKKKITEKDGTVMNGVEIKMHFKDLNQMLSSRVFAAATQMFPFSASKSTTPSIVLSRVDSMFGTKYTASGSFSILGQYGEKATDDMLTQIKTASAKFTFKMPTPFVKSNSTVKSDLGTTLSWSAIEGTNADISFDVFVPNLAMLLAVLIILLLLIIVFILSLKLKRMKQVLTDDVDSENDDEDLFPEPENELIDEISDANIEENFDTEEKVNEENFGTEDTEKKVDEEKVDGEEE